MTAPLPDNLFVAAAVCLAQTDPAAKVELTRAVAAAYAAGRLVTDADAAPPAPEWPGRPARPRLVAPRTLPHRGLGSVAGRAAFVHAIAHIEFNAINLAWDAVLRFRSLPEAFRADWIRVADDEARHFSLLAHRLDDLGHAYGDFDAHDGLWQMARDTADSDLARMALVPRVLEARGLDVTPGMLERLRGVGDADSLAILELILSEEVAHVEAGSRWFRWCCARDGLDPEPTFARLLRERAPGVVRGPFNLDARRRAGFSETELAMLERGATGAPT